MRPTIFTLILALLATTALQAADKPTFQKGSVAAKKVRKKGTVAHDPALPNVLIIGDSISMGYTGTVTKQLAGVCNVIRPSGNHQGTTRGLEIVDDLLANQKKWDVVHFNWGLHDLKHVKVAGTSQNSKDANDPRQADPTAYKANLTKLVQKLKAGTDAKLIFATTTPYPDVPSPVRKASYAIEYNTIAKEIMKANDVEVNDLYTFMKPKLKELQRPQNVHFLPQGSAALGEQVANAIRRNLPKK